MYISVFWLKVYNSLAAFLSNQSIQVPPNKLVQIQMKPPVEDIANNNY